MDMPRQITDALTAPFRATDDVTSPGTGEWGALRPDVPVTIGTATFDPAGVFAFIRVVPRSGDAEAVDLSLAAYRGNPTLTVEAYTQAGQGDGFALDLLGDAIGLFAKRIITAGTSRLRMRSHSSPVPVAFLDGFSTITVQLNFTRN